MSHTLVNGHVIHSTPRTVGVGHRPGIRLVGRTGKIIDKARKNYQIISNKESLWLGEPTEGISRTRNLPILRKLVFLKEESIVRYNENCRLVDVII